jgi:hypothetical protein
MPWHGNGCRWVGLAGSALLAACATYSAVEPVYVDTDPLMSCTLDARDTLAGRFDDYRVHPSRDVMLTGEAGANQVQVAAHDFFETSADGRTDWSTKVAVFLYTSPDRAEAAFRAHCDVDAKGYPADAVRRTDADDRRSCLTPLGQLRNDPEGGRLATSTYVQSAVVQRDRVVVAVLETRHGFAHGTTPADVALGDVAKRLCAKSKKTRKTSR